MTNEQREAIEYLKESVLIYKNTIPKISDAIDTALSLIQEQQEENKKKDKIIEEMARFITNKDIDEDICRYQVVEHCKDEEHGVTTNVCINCIKQYFENKAKE